ncbi:MAG: two-component system response regulator [Desulfococcaceae bacterium]|jgi:putative two-component system response regulator|nr:two-component system response regulator [Desulfococcaceae bacterium]
MKDKSHRILIVDDERFNINVLVEILKSDYRIIVAKSGEEALKRVRTSAPPDLILLDIMMPRMDGYTVCSILQEDRETRNIPVIFITALGEEQDETRGFEVGGVDYITKPVSPPVVMARVKTHLSLRDTRQELAKQNHILEDMVEERTRELYNSRMEIIHRLVFSAEFKDPETGSHIKRMSHYSALLAEGYGLSKKECDTILLASPMHDIGKIGIPDIILLKPGKLDPEEWIIMKKHPGIGAKILSKSKSRLMRAGQQIAVSHHERWDGSGYPQGKKGKDIPLYGRIAALADVFDALTTKRPYKTAWPIEKAADEIIKQSGRHFDPELVEVFTDVLSRFLEIRTRFPE